MIKQKKNGIDSNWKQLQLKLASTQSRRNQKQKEKLKLNKKKAVKEGERIAASGNIENKKEDTKNKDYCLTREDQELVHSVFHPQAANPKKKEETRKLALDCEMVELDGAINGLARVSVVNYFGHILLDTLVKPPRGTRITDYRTKYSGITPKLMWSSPSQLITTHEEALLKTKRLLKDAVVVGHSLWNDFAALEYDSHPQKDLRDLSSFPKFRDDLGRAIALRKLSHRFLGKNIQEKSHSSVEDARAALALYRLNEKEMDGEAEGITSKKIRQYFGKGKHRSLNAILDKKAKKKDKKKNKLKRKEEGTKENASAQPRIQQQDKPQNS